MFATQYQQHTTYTTIGSIIRPGIYFIHSLLDMAKADPALSRFLTPRLDDFRDFGGVRLEDVVAVTSDGIDNFTLCPRTIDEIESVSLFQTFSHPRVL